MSRAIFQRGVLALLTAAVSVAVAAAPASAASKQVLVTDNAFVKPGVAVTAGDSVTWTYPTGNDLHNVHFEDGSFTEPDQPRPPSWTRTREFPSEGVYRYYCDEHGAPGGVGMAGIVYVNAQETVPGAPPVASFTVSSSTVQVGGTISLDAGASTEPDQDDEIVRHEWDLHGDGTFEIDSGAFPTTSGSFPAPGTFDVALRVTDRQGHTDTTTRRVTVTSPPPPPPPPPPHPPPPPPVALPAPMPPPPAPPAADDTAPRVSALSVRPSAFRAKSSGPTVARSGGALLRYRVSEDATTTFTVQRIEQGRRKGRSCQRPSRANRKGARCTRYVTLRGSFRHDGKRAKLNSVRFSGRIGGRKLGVGRYRLRAVAKDPAGNPARVRTASFRIKR